MHRTLIRIATVALFAAGTVALASTPAMASPSGLGWSGSWEYTSSTSLTVNEAILGATLSAIGTDTGNSRTFSVSLTDTNASDGQCAYVAWDDGTLNTTNATCNGTISFTPYSEDGEVYAQLCLRKASTNTIAHCNYLDIQSTYGYGAFMRSAGYGFSYAYHTPNEYATENWDATIMLGQVNYDVSGFDNDGGPYDRLLENFLFTFSTSTFSCASGQLLDTETASSVQLCGPEQSVQGPSAISTGQGGSAMAGCTWPTLVRKGATIVKSCIAQSVPMPN